MNYILKHNLILKNIKIELPYKPAFLLQNEWINKMWRAGDIAQW
jgi:hypothetical protein